MKKISVIIVDDSALIRSLLSDILSSDPEINVVATAVDAFDARDKIKQFNPDVITLDIEMPKMDGITFLKKIMRLRPMPVVMISTLTQQGAEITLEALREGAVDFVAKPKFGSSTSIERYADEIIAKVKAASQANLVVLDSFQRSGLTLNKPIVSSSGRDHKKSVKLIAIGASTGGTEATQAVLSKLPASCPGIVIVQHIPVSFSFSYAARLNQHSEIEVCIAEDNQQILDGHAYLAPGDKHLLVEKVDQGFVCRISDQDAVNRHKPSVDVLFNSVAENIGARAIGLMLTGMGKDGAQGMLNMKQAGAFNFVQDKNSCVVWGMPKQAIEIGATDLQVPLNDIADQIIALV